MWLFTLEIDERPAVLIRVSYPGAPCRLEWDLHRASVIVSKLDDVQYNGVPLFDGAKHVGFRDATPEEIEHWHALHRENDGAYLEFLVPVTDPTGVADSVH